MTSTEVVLLMFVLVVLIWLSGISVFLVFVVSKYREFSKGIDKKDIVSILSQLKKDNLKALKNLELHDGKFESLDKQVLPFVQKIGFVRYNPFGNTGGDQSFCLCLLDGKNDGVLITSLHARDQTRIYTKEIQNGKCQHEGQLAAEEKDCIKKAMKWS